MKTVASAIAAAGFCFDAGMVQATQRQDCAEEYRKAIKEVESLYQGTVRTARSSMPAASGSTERELP